MASDAIAAIDGDRITSDTFLVALFNKGGEMLTAKEQRQIFVLVLAAVLSFFVTRELNKRLDK